MIRLFDYVFYRVCKAYKSTIESIPEVMAMYVLTLMQTLNLMTIILITGLLTNKMILSKPMTVSIMVLIVICNYRRYIYKENNNYPSLAARWIDQSNSPLYGVMVLIYLILSFIICLGLAIYAGSLHRTS